MLTLAQIGKHYEENHDLLVKKLSRRAGTVENAEDIVHDAYANAMAYRHTFNEGGNFGNWFTSILNNALRDFNRSERMLGMSIEFDEEQAERIPMPTIAPHEAERIKALISTKKPNHQKVLSLYFLSGYKPREIAKIMPALSSGYIRWLVNAFKKEAKG